MKELDYSAQLSYGYILKLRYITYNKPIQSLLAGVFGGDRRQRGFRLVTVWLLVAAASYDRSIAKNQEGCAEDLCDSVF